jgi:hypothetical protein
VQWSTFVGIGEAVASTPTQSIFSNLVNYGIEVGLFLNSCQTKSSNANRFFGKEKKNSILGVCPELKYCLCSLVIFSAIE